MLTFCQILAVAARDLTATVATRQLLLADFYADGLFHPDCLKLAQLHCKPFWSSRQKQHADFGSSNSLQLIA